MLAKRKKTYSEIVAKNVQTINAEVTLPDELEELPMGTRLFSEDGGKTFNVIKEVEGEETPKPNGVLTDYLRSTETTSVLITGSIIERNLPKGVTEEERVALFENKIILV